MAEDSVDIPRYAIAVRHKGLLYTMGRAAVVNVGRRDADKIVAVYTKAGKDGSDSELQVWVHRDYTGYRAGFRQAWIEGWQTTLGRKLSANERDTILSKTDDVDHIFPKDLALKYQYEWLRIKELPKDLNRSWQNKLGTLGPLNNIYYLTRDAWDKMLMHEFSGNS